MNYSPWSRILVKDTWRQKKSRYPLQVSLTKAFCMCETSWKYISLLSFKVDGILWTLPTFPIHLCTLHISLRAFRTNKQFCTVTLQSKFSKRFPDLSCELFWINGYTKRKQAMGTRLFISLALFTSHLIVWLDLRFPGWERGLLGQDEVLGKVQL